MCEESCDSLDVKIAHYIIGLDMVGTVNQPGLHMCIWCCFSCCSKPGHIPGRNQFIRSTLDKEKRSRRNTCNVIYRTYCIKIDTVHHLHRKHDARNNWARHER